MAASFVQAKSTGIGAGTSVSVNLTGVAAGNHLAAVVGSFNQTMLAPTSTPSATWTNAVPEFNNAGIRARGDYSENVASGSWTVNGRTSVTTGITIAVQESAGVATSSSLGVTGTGTSAASSVSLTSAITPAAGSILMTGAFESAGSGNSAFTITSTGNTPFTVDEVGGAGTSWDSGAFMGGGSAHFANTAATATNNTWTSGHSATNMSCLTMEFVQSGAAVQAPTFPQWTALGAAIRLLLPKPGFQLGEAQFQALDPMPSDFVLPAVPARPELSPAFIANLPLYLPIPVTPPPILGQVSQSLTRPELSLGFVAAAPVQNVSFEAPKAFFQFPAAIRRGPVPVDYTTNLTAYVLLPALRGYLPELRDRPRWVLGFTQNNTVYLLLLPTDPVIAQAGRWPDIIRRIPVPRDWVTGSTAYVPPPVLLGVYEVGGNMMYNRLQRALSFPG